MEEILSYLSTHGDVHGPYGIVLRAVTEQIKQFQQTGYVDARSSAELQFERHLKFVKGAFTIATEWIESTKGEFLDCVQGLAGPRLFPSATRVVDNQEIDTKQAEQVVQSFRSDRRLVRLVLLRLFTDTLIRKFKRTQQQK
ncbi:hypothetical protein AC1031_009027 [Aphanomyces cochlioides]|nr:hypothetical protein AC1031_009027 [Aphanomyces cochlioides]